MSVGIKKVEGVRNLWRLGPDKWYPENVEVVVLSLDDLGPPSS